MARVRGPLVLLVAIFSFIGCALALSPGNVAAQDDPFEIPLYYPTPVAADCEGGIVTPPDLVTFNSGGYTYDTDFSAWDEETGGFGYLNVYPDVPNFLPDPLPDGWTAISGGAQYGYPFDGVACTPTISLSPPTPVYPNCDGGIVSPPDFTYFNGEGYTYYTIFTQWDEETGGPGFLVVELTGEYELPLPLPEGWVAVVGGAQYQFEFEGAGCTLEALIFFPTIVDVSCQDGAQTIPSFLLTPGIGANVVASEPAAAGVTVVFTATLVNPYVWPDNLGDWELNGSNQAVYSYSYIDPDCRIVVPVDDPEITDTDCSDGSQVAPSFILPTADGIVFSADPAVPVAGETVTFTATADGTHKIEGAVGSEWLVSDDASSASQSFTFADPDCRIVVPIDDPEITDTSCGAGAQIPPSLTLPTATGITFIAEPAVPVAGQTVTFTATADSTHKIEVAGGSGWLIGENAGSASQSFTFADPDCRLGAQLLEVEVTNTACLNGEQIAPVVTNVPVDGVSFTIDPAVFGPGDSVVITATADAFHTLTTELGSGWIVDEAQTSATFTFFLADPDCTLPAASPERPLIVDVSCNGPVQTAPVITLVSTEGLTYELEDPSVAGSVQAAAIAGGTVTVFATVEPGFRFPDVLPEGWTLVDNTTATFTFTFANPVCTGPVIPEGPEITEASCVNDVVFNPAVEFEETLGLTYAIDGDVEPGGSALILASLLDGFEFISPLPSGWTQIDDTTASFAIEFADTGCVGDGPGSGTGSPDGDPVDPRATPTPSNGTEGDGTGKDPVTSLPATGQGPTSPNASTSGLIAGTIAAMLLLAAAGARRTKS